MTETERWVNQTCERIVAGGHVRLYRDLYRDLRETLPCGVACRLIALGLGGTRGPYDPLFGSGRASYRIDRARAIAALRRLERFDRRRLHPFDPDGGRVVGRNA